MPYCDPELRRAKDRRYYAANRLVILRKKQRPLREEMPVGVGRYLATHSDRRMSGHPAETLGWALAMWRT